MNSTNSLIVLFHIDELTDIGDWLVLLATAMLLLNISTIFQNGHSNDISCQY